MNYCHFWGRRVHCPYCQVAILWWWWSWSLPAAWLTASIIICCYFTLGGCIGLAIRTVIVIVIVTGKYFTLGGCCGLGITTAVTGFLVVRLSSRALWMFLRYASIPVRHIFTGTCTSPCFREYFSLGGCAGLVSYNIFGYFRVYFTLGGCTYVVMSNAICGGVVTLVSLELAQWYCREGLFRLVLFLGHTTDRSPLRSWFKSLSALACDNSISISKSGSPALMVHLGGCDLVLLAGMVLTLLTGSPANFICFLGLMALVSGYSVSAI